MLARLSRPGAVLNSTTSAPVGEVPLCLTPSGTTQHWPGPSRSVRSSNATSNTPLHTTTVFRRVVVAVPAAGAAGWRPHQPNLHAPSTDDRSGSAAAASCFEHGREIQRRFPSYLLTASGLPLEPSLSPARAKCPRSGPRRPQGRPTARSSPRPDAERGALFGLQPLMGSSSRGG